MLQSVAEIEVSINSHMRGIIMDSIKQLEKMLNGAWKKTRRYIKAYKKVGTDELINEAEKCYVYEQYELAYEICRRFINEFNDTKNTMESLARTYELRALIMYYHSREVYGVEKEEHKDAAFKLLADLDSKSYEIYDSRYALGQAYAENGYYDKAINSFVLWMDKRDKYSGVKALVEMFKREQYDTDEQYKMLFGFYYYYYQGQNIENLLLKAAKYIDEYFPQYIHESICEKVGIPSKQISKIHYTDEDFALPYSLRCFDCAEFIRLYVRNSSKPTLEECMLFLARQNVQNAIESKTSRAREKELKDALLRAQISNENARLDIMRREAEEQENHYKKMQSEMEYYNQQMKRYQDESLKNQKKVNDKLSSIGWDVNRIKWRL